MEIIDFKINLPGKGEVVLTFDSRKRIADVLKTGCKKFNLNPEDYEIRHNNEILPQEESLDESFLPNGARLSLVSCPTAKALVELVTGGIVYKGSFCNTASLWDVYQKLVKGRHISESCVKISFLGMSFNGKNVLKNTKISSLHQGKSKIVLHLDRNCNQPNTESRVLHAKTSKKLEGEKINAPKISPANKINTPPTVNSTKEEITKKPFTFPRQSSLLKCVASVDANYYTSIRDKLKGVAYLDQRKGLTYKLNEKNKLSKAGLTLLGLVEDEKNESRNQENTEEIILKIVFPQQTVVQASFRQYETVDDIYKFIGPYVKMSDVVLCNKLADCDLDRGTLIKDLECSPESTIFVRYSSQAWQIRPDPITPEAIQPAVPKVSQRKKIWKLK